MAKRKPAPPPSPASAAAMPKKAKRAPGPPADAPAPPPATAAEAAAAAAVAAASTAAAEALPVPRYADGVDDAAFKNRERVLLLSSRGITSRFRHFMLDLAQILPHSKKDAKLDTKSERAAINEVADERCCSSVLFFEARKRGADSYLWLARPPDGPSVKFLVTGVHTMAELKLTGNHMRGSRPVLSFHAAFDGAPHWRLVKEMLMRAFAVPRRHPKSKPFVDHVVSFSIADGRVWVRNYQVVPPADRKSVKGAAGVTLAEVGPRATLQPIKVFAGSFGGRVLYDNDAFVSPGAVRSALKKRAAGGYAARVAAQSRRRAHVAAHPAVRGELADVFREA